jgi:heptosyltransferase-3
MNVLFITASRIGDGVLTTGILHHLITEYPEVRLTMAAGPVSMPLFDDVPQVVARHKLQKRGPFGHWIDLWHKCHSSSWDWIIDLRGSLFSWTLKTKKRSIWRTPKRIMHRVEAIGACVGLTPPPKPHIYLSPERLKIWHDVNFKEPYLVVAPAANWLGKEWPLDRFQDLINRLWQGPCKGWKLGVIAAPDEYGRLTPFLDYVTDFLIPIDPQRSLLDSAVFLKKAALFIGNDSGLMHMAAALDVPTLGLFGPSPPVLYDPYGPKGQAVRTPLSYETLMKMKQDTPQTCFMESLSVETVYNAVCAHGEKWGVFSCVA